MKTIDTLIKDIYTTIQTKGWLTDDIATELSASISKRLQAQHSERKERPSLRLSQMGPRCPCALWYSIHKPELGEPIPPYAEIKYSYGHVIEGLAIALAKAAGHEVTGEQDECHVDGIKGHRDCVIDGCLVDVKSTSTPGFKRFQDGSIKDSDTFGYLDQLDGYLVGSCNDQTVRVKDRGYILAVDKTLGHMVIYEHRHDDSRREALRERIARYKDIVGSNIQPQCTCKTVPDGKSGNIKLDVAASYSPHKYNCFPKLRTFLYANGPVYLTHVERKPDVIEVDRYGNKVYSV